MKQPQSARRLSGGAPSGEKKSQGRRETCCRHYQGVQARLFSVNFFPNNLFLEFSEAYLNGCHFSFCFFPLPKPESISMIKKKK